MRMTIVIDMQNDFVSGVLGSEQAKAIVPKLVDKLDNINKDINDLLFTKDTHKEKDNYLETWEGKFLPTVHCVKNTDGWNIIKELQKFTTKENVIEKNSFGTTRLPSLLKKYDEVEFCGVCTDICVISNAYVVKAFYPEKTIIIDSNCCAGTNEENHQTALKAMKTCGFIIK